MKLVKFWLCALFLFSASLASAAAPDFSGIGAVSNNADSTWAKAADVITFTLTLNTAEDSNGTGFITFDIGSLLGQTTTLFPDTTGSPSTTHTATYTVPAGVNGAISITGLTFSNSDPAAIINVPGFPVTPSPTVNVDTTAPVFQSIGAVSNNTDTTKAKEGDSVTFTLTLFAADTWMPGNTLNYSIGAGASTALPAAFISTSGLATKNMATRSFTVLAGSTGDINIDSLSFTDRAGNAITGFLAGPASPNVAVDTTAPVVTFTDDVEAGPAMSDDVVITVTEADPDLASYEYGFSADAVCDGTDTFGTPLTSGATVTFNTEVTNMQYICAKAEDNSGNITYALSANDLNIDVTPPSITSVTQVSSNTTPSWARDGSTVTYTITYSEDVTVSAVNTASSANNATGAVTEVSAATSSTDTLVVTVMAGDNGIITPNVDFDITDAAGNTVTITSLGAITGGSGSNTITADTIIPVLDVVTILSNNILDTEWAKTGDEVKIQIDASEILGTNTVNSTITTEAATRTKTCGAGNCETYDLTLVTDGNEAEGVVAFTIDFKDRAQNPGVQVTGTTDGSTVTFDKTAPTVTPVTIASNNALDTTLAKSNDTITVTFTVNDNLATTASISGAPTILSSPAVANVTAVGAGQTIARFTDGSETSEVVTPFSFAVQDEAGNVSATTTATTDASQVQFDRTNPVVSEVKISATSADASAFTGDDPTYYAKQGDTIDFSFEICDYVDSQNNPPTGDLFSSVGLTMTDGGLTGATCTTPAPASNTVGVRKWTAQLTGIDGTEGTVTFDIDVYDNAGNGLVNVTGTTDGSSVIFDKTAPTVPTDMVDLGGAATLGYKPAANAATYTWTDDDDPLGGAPVSGVYQFDVRYNNANTGINEMITITAPTRSFSPAAMIPDLDPYTVNMNVRDKAGNGSGEMVIYTQKYGIEVTGTVTDADTGAPIAGTFVNVIAPAGSVCNGPTQEICNQITDAAGKYLMTVAPNTTYTIDGIKTPDYYIAKDSLAVTTMDVEANISLKHVEDGDVQTGLQGTIITTDTEFDNNGTPQTTYLNAFSLSGSVSVQETAAGIEITSTSTVTDVTSNNPNVTITNQGNNVWLVVGAGNILGKTDLTNAASSVSASFASGSNRVGTRAPLGGASAGFQAGISRSDRVVNGGRWTEAESREFAKLLNNGSRYRVNQYVNRNGYTVFAGYQKGRMAIADMTGSNPNVRMAKQIVFRGARRGSSTQRFGVAVSDRKEVVKDIFYTDLEKDMEPETLVVEEGNQQKAARPRVETKKTALTYNNPEVAGYGRRTEMYPSVLNKKANDARYVNKFARVMPEAQQSKSRLQGKNTDIIVFRNQGRDRNSKKLALGRYLNQNPRFVASKDEVVRR